jgi:hypothetical protein
MKLLHVLLFVIIAIFIGSCTQKQAVKTPESSIKVDEVKVAMILPTKVIGRYAHTTSTAAFAYYLTRDHPLSLKTFTIEEESSQAIEKVLEQIKAEGFHYVIAPMTHKGAEIIVAQEDELYIFFPTIHKNDMPTSKSNIFFGAIDYKAQLDQLMPLVTSPLVIMYGTSQQGRKLLSLTEERYKAIAPKHTKNTIFTFGIDKKRSNVRDYFKDNKELDNATFILNTPLIKSSMILSQFSSYDMKVNRVLSTQINYDPLILSMTQKKDHNTLYVANSITIYNDALVQANILLSNDIQYDWINYATTVGADFFYYMMTDIDRLYDLPLKEHQVIYPVTIVTPENGHFMKAVF